MNVLIPRRCIVDKQFYKKENRQSLYLLYTLLYWANPNDEILINNRLMFDIFGIDGTRKKWFKDRNRIQFKLMNDYFNISLNYKELDIKNTQCSIFDFSGIYEYKCSVKINYISIEENDIKLIENNSMSNQQKYNMFNIYLYLLATSLNRRYCMGSYESICNFINISRNTLSSCIKKLQELNLIVYNGGTNKRNCYVIISKCKSIDEANKILIKQIAKKS